MGARRPAWQRQMDAAVVDRPDHAVEHFGREVGLERIEVAGNDDDHRQGPAAVGNLDGLIALGNRRREELVVVHQGHLDRRTIGAGEGPVERRLRVEGELPGGIQGDGVDEHYHVRRVDGVCGEQFGDEVVGSVGDPAVDRLPLALGVVGEVGLRKR